MNDKLLKFIKSLYEHEEFKGLKYSFTINLKRVVADFKPETFDSNALIKIAILISEQEVESFNFTLIDKEPMDYENVTYWYNLNYVFHGENDINLNLNFLSSGLSLDQLPVNMNLKENHIGKMKKIAYFYKKSSKELYNLLK